MVRISSGNSWCESSGFVSVTHISCSIRADLSMYCSVLSMGCRKMERSGAGIFRISWYWFVSPWDLLVVYPLLVLLVWVCCIESEAFKDARLMSKARIDRNEHRLPSHSQVVDATRYIQHYHKFFQVPRASSRRNKCRKYR
jgi:hypothetical protein